MQEKVAQKSHNARSFFLYSALILFPLIYRFYPKPIQEENK